MDNREIRTPSPLVGHDVGEPGDIIGWAKINPDSLRFAEAINPRTGTPLLGLAVEVVLKDNTRDVWINTRNGWRRSDSWFRKAFLRRLDKERETGEVVPEGLEKGPEGVGSI